MIRDLGETYDDKLPRIPFLTDDAQSIIDKEQRKLAEKKALDLSAEGTEFNRANAIIAETKLLLADPNYKLNIFQTSAYIDALKTVGRYDEAAKYGDEESTEIWNLIWSDKDDCGCSDIQTVILENGKVKPVSYSRKFTRRLIFSQRRKEWVGLIVCSGCGDISVK